MSFGIMFMALVLTICSMRYKVFHTTATVVCLAALFGLLYLIWDASANDQWFFWLIVGVGILYAFGLFLLNKIFTF